MILRPEFCRTMGRVESEVGGPFGLGCLLVLVDWDACRFDAFTVVIKGTFTANSRI